MNARNDVKRYQSFDARVVLAAVRRRVAARADFVVARWLQRCAANVEAAQRLFETDDKPAPLVRDGRGPCRLVDTLG